MYVTNKLENSKNVYYNIVRLYLYAKGEIEHEFI